MSEEIFSFKHDIQHFCWVILSVYLNQYYRKSEVIKNKLSNWNNFMNFMNFMTSSVMKKLKPFLHHTIQKVIGQFRKLFMI